jgi:acyl carrier protein
MSEAGGPGPSEGWPDARAIETWLISYLSGLLRVEPASIDVRLPFTWFGLSSADGVILAGDLERWLGGRRLPGTLAWDFPTIEALAQHLASGVLAAGDFTKDDVLASPPRERDTLEELLSEIERLPEEEAVRLQPGAAPQGPRPAQDE